MIVEATILVIFLNLMSTIKWNFVDVPMFGIFVRASSVYSATNSIDLFYLLNNYQCFYTQKHLQLQCQTRILSGV